MRGELQATSSDDATDHRERDDALAAFGLRLDAPAPQLEPFHLWPEHVPALVLWTAVQTQWRHGFDGPTGLDYAGVRVVMRHQRAPRERFDELQIMERAALAEWASQRETRRR